jgi:hypothetical protein
MYNFQLESDKKESAWTQEVDDLIKELEVAQARAREAEKRAREAEKALEARDLRYKTFFTAVIY